MKLIREEIETTYRTQMAATLEQLEVQMGSIKKKDLYSHPKFVKEMVDYIVDDYKTVSYTHLTLPTKLEV